MKIVLSLVQQPGPGTLVLHEEVAAVLLRELLSPTSPPKAKLLAIGPQFRSSPKHLSLLHLRYSSPET